MVGTAHAGTNWAKRFPTGTGMEVVTPTSGDATYWRLDQSNNPPTATVDIGAQALTTTLTGTFGSTYQAVLGDDGNTRAGYFVDGTRTVILADGGDAASFTDGVTSVWLAGNYGAGDFEDGTNTVYLADGTYAVNATGDSFFDGDAEFTGTGTFSSVKTSYIYDSYDSIAYFFY